MLNNSLIHTFYNWSKFDLNSYEMIMHTLTKNNNENLIWLKNKNCINLIHRFPKTYNCNLLHNAIAQSGFGSSKTQSTLMGQNARSL
jgi:hypothetical protein